MLDGICDATTDAIDRFNISSSRQKKKFILETVAIRFTYVENIFRTHFECHKLLLIKDIRMEQMILILQEFVTSARQFHFIYIYMRNDYKHTQHTHVHINHLVLALWNGNLDAI